MKRYIVEFADGHQPVDGPQGIVKAVEEYMGSNIKMTVRDDSPTAHGTLGPAK